MVMHASLDAPRQSGECRKLLRPFNQRPTSGSNSQCKLTKEVSPNGAR